MEKFTINVICLIGKKNVKKEREETEAHQ